MKNIKGIIFDLDGTLIKSNINFLEMKKKIIDYLKSLKLDFKIEEVPSTSISELIEYTINKVEDEKLRKKILKETNKLMNEEELKSLTTVSPIEGVKETLKTLKSEGFRIGVLTRGCREYALKSLEKTCLKDLIDCLIARDDLDKPKPNPVSALKLIKKMKLTPKEVLMIGDHVLDFLCAEKAGIKFIGVLTGFSNEKDFKKIGCEVIKRVNELPLLFK
ncbi:HAD family hydrolase [Candidatus Bathyarchaeota archaeon]|nr:HAD family hydrolase [Candidatus Bathyarchaeota archaeon]